MTNRNHLNSQNHTYNTPKKVFWRSSYDVIRVLSVGYPPESIGSGTPSGNVFSTPRYHLGKFGALFHSVTIFTLSDWTIKTKFFQIYIGNIESNNIWELVTKRSWRNMLKRGQCKRKCLLSSLPLLQTHIGLKRAKLCLNLCPFKALNSILSIVRSLIPWISRML